MRDVVRFLCMFLFFLLHLPHVYWFSDHLTYVVLLFGLYLLMCVIHLSLHVLFLFSLYAHDSYILYATYYLCFILRCRDEFCLKCFINIGCQSLLAINSFLAKFFKGLCYDRFYCIQQVSMSWLIYDFSHMFICLLWFCHDCQRGRFLGHLWFNVRNICQYRIG